jgi:hypothetical protein
LSAISCQVLTFLSSPLPPATQSDDWDKQTVLRGGQKRVATVTKSESAVNNARRMGIAVSTESKGPAGSNSRGGRES